MEILWGLTNIVKENEGSQTKLKYVISGIS